MMPATARRPHVSLQTTEPTTFGHGWISGAAGLALGLLGLAAVLCFRFPGWLTFADLRAHYPIPWVRALLHLVLVAAFGLGTISVCLRQNKALGLGAVGSVLVAALLGGSRVPIDGELRDGPFLGLDWFLLNLIAYSAVYVPLERAFALRREQPIFRPGWRTDLCYFFVASLLVQVTTLLTLRPAATLFDWARHPAVVAWVADLPFPVQFLLVLLATDLVQYWVHRAFHSVPALWRFHAVHHSAAQMDWIAGSRLHLVDAITTRALTYVPVYVLGFPEPVVVAYVGWVVVQATFIHANVRWQLRPLRWLLSTPAFHHWHHAAEPQACDVNFAVHLPVLDRLFGTHYLPDRWPTAYGLIGGGDVPAGFLRQFVYPFTRGRGADRA
jgi:sterol desaturase/sphingolipid hydroxylase (fatty acid hydroxylase superfamily)